jgi:hypothetical protein
MSDPESSLEDLARYWDDNAAAWAREVRRGHDVAREFLNNPAFLALIGGLRGRQVLDAGCTETDLLDAYPRLKREDIQAAIGYAADVLAHEETLLLTPREATPE